VRVDGLDIESGSSTPAHERPPRRRGPRRRRSYGSIPMPRAW